MSVFFILHAIFTYGSHSLDLAKRFVTTPILFLALLATIEHTLTPSALLKITNFRERPDL